MSRRELDRGSGDGDSPYAPMSATTACPACGKAVDPLRAGHVAILEAGFQYFCDEACKRAFVVMGRGPLPSQVETAEPPRVAAVAPHAPVFELPPDDPSSTPDPAPSRMTSQPAVEVPPEAVPTRHAPTPRDEPQEAPPIPTASADAVSAPPPDASAPTLLPYFRHGSQLLGVVAGFLAPGLALLGPAAQGARFALATVAVLACCLRPVFVPLDPSDVHPLASVASVGAVWAAAFYARLLESPRALDLASVAGLAAAVQLVSAVLVDRAREGVRTARAWLQQRLDVPIRVVSGETTVLAQVEDVKAGEAIVALTGDTLGVDARITAGEAVVTPWLDASREVKKREGDSVVAGARVVSGTFRAVTTWAGADRAWVKLAESPRLRPDVVGHLPRRIRLSLERGGLLAAGLGLGLGMANGASGVDILASAAMAGFCVAGLGVAGIVALHQARGPMSALAYGIVYRDAEAFDRAGQADVGVLCSRGTLLRGSPEIVALETLGSLSSRDILALAAGASVASSHPSNAALREAARLKNERPESVRHATYHQGLGVTALTARGEPLVVGSRALLLREKVSVALAERRITELEAAGRSVLLVAVAGKLVGLVALQDGLRPGARAAVQRLLDAGIEPVLLSGEARETCETIGRALDIEHIRPEVLPADRGAEVRALGEGGHVVAVLGLPEEDDAALVAAHVAVALGAAGSNPGEWGVALASDDVRDAARSLAIARQTRDRTRVAMVLGLAPGLAAAGGVALGILPLPLAPLLSLAGLAAAVVHARR